MNFKVGDCVVVVSVGRASSAYKIGAETVITEISYDPWNPADYEDGYTGPKYKTTVSDEGKWFQASNLRLKRPPADYDGNQVGSWDLIPWQPKKERV
jgi:hypothetical protein